MAGTQDHPTFADWLRGGLAARGWIPADLVRAGVVKSESTVSKWLNDKNPPGLPETVIKIAELTGQDAIPGLYAAGHGDVARFAEKLRADPSGALIEHEMAAANDDPHLAKIDAAAARGVISQAERDRMRADFLRRTAESIRLIESDYNDAVARRERSAPEPGGNGRAAL